MPTKNPRRRRGHPPPEAKPNEACLWSAPGIHGLELFSARLSTHSFSRHSHPSYTIGLNDAGLGRFRTGNRIHWAQPGGLNLLNPGEVHTGEPAQKDLGWVYRDFYVSPRLVETILLWADRKSGRMPFFRNTTLEDPEVWHALDSAYRCLCRASTPLERETLLFEAIEALFRRHPSNGLDRTQRRPEPAAIARGRRYLQERYAQPVALKELAEVTGLSPFHLTRAFRKATGLPPHAYQFQLRLEAARRDLRTAKPLVQIALDHGFCDQSHLSRRFRRAYGVSPGCFRKSNSVQEPSSG